jgi:hypothetical protein
MQLYIAADARKMRRKDMTNLGEKASRFIAASFYTDTMGLLRTFQPEGGATAVVDGKGKEKEKEAPAAGVQDAKAGSQWLLLVRPQGVFEVYPNHVYPRVLAHSLDQDLVIAQAHFGLFLFTGLGLASCHNGQFGRESIVHARRSTSAAAGAGCRSDSPRAIWTVRSSAPSLCELDYCHKYVRKS